MFRKTALTSAIIGAGLVSTAGAAFAGDAPSESHHGHHGHSSTQSSSDCSNAFGGSVDNGGSTQFGGVNGSQGALQGNLCDIANGNSILSGNHISVLSLDESDLPAVETEAPESAPATAAPATTTAPAATTTPATTAPATTTPATGSTTSTPIQG